MTAAECVLAIEDYWKPMKPKSQRLYINKIGRFNRDQIDLIYDKLLEDCQWIPKIKDIFDAARDLGFLQESRERKTLGKKGCPTCEEAGWIAEVVTTSDGMTVQAVVPCECRKQ